MLWTAFAVATPAAVRLLRPHLEPRLGSRATHARALAPWVYGLLPAYLALITGAISRRDAGLYGFRALGWLIGLAADGIALAVFAVGLRSRRGTRAAAQTVEAGLPDPLRGALDEPRWALYRAAGRSWIGDATLGVGFGLGCALVEWALTRSPWRPEARANPQTWLLLARMAASSLFFALSGNLWLTALAQGGLLAMTRRRGR